MATNPYAITELQPVAANDSGNPYAIGTIEADGRTALRGSLISGQSANPDQTAEAVKLSRKTGAPYEAIQSNLPEIQQGERLDAYEKMLAGTPATRKFLTLPQNAAMANDDVGNLTEVEKAIRGFIDGGGGRIKRPDNLVMNSPEYADAVRRARIDNPALDDDAARSLVMNGAMVDNQVARVGAVRGPEASTGSVLLGLAGAAGRMPETFSAQLGYIAADILGLDKTQVRNRLANLETRDQSGTPQFETETGKGFYAGGVSTIQNTPGIALSIATGNPAIGLGMAGAQSAVPAYSKYRERGASGAMAAFGALSEGAVEVATELLPMQSLLKVFGKNGQGAALQFFKSQFQEQWTEQIATVAQDAIDTAIANPNKTWGQFVAERPGAAYQTFLATLVQSGAIAAAHTAAQKVGVRSFTATESAARAEEAAATAETLTKLADASKLRARDPESFAQFVNQVAEDGEVPAELYIDGETLTNTLNQAGITMERLQMVAPVVAAQMRAASFVPGADIRVPVAEFAAAGADITTPLIDHLRETPDAMSRAEAKQYIAAEGDRIRSDVQAELGKLASRQAAKQSIETVASRFEAELNAAGRFRPEVNKAYASLMGNFYAAQAARADMPLEDFLQRYQLRVTGKTGQGAQTLEQRNPSDVTRTQAAVADFLGTDTLPNALGRVVTATAADIKATWEPLIGRKAQMGSEGEKGVAQAFFDPASKTVFLIADNIREGDEAAVLAHELMHKHGQAALGKGGWDRLHGVINAWANAEEGSEERAVYNYARFKVEAVGLELSSQEMFPYAVEAALKMGVQPSKKAKTGTVSRWLNDVQTAMQAAWAKVTGKPEAFDLQDLVNLAYGIAQMENPALAIDQRAQSAIKSIAPETLDVPGVLLELGKLESLYQYPKSTSKDIEAIAADKGLQVSPVDRNAAESKEWMLANTTPEGAQSWMVTLPAGQKATVVQDGQQVYINVSSVGEGNGGSAVYDLAANYAANNGLTFIGDPNGVSAAAMRRRLENMLSSAVKYGTTDHLQPHPDQLAGNAAIGVPALKWTDGDTAGNILSMVEASVAATESTNPVATQNVSFDSASQSFVDGDNSPLSAEDLRALLSFDKRAPGTGQAGIATLQRNAIFRALLSGPDAGRALLDAVRGQQGDPSADIGATRGTFYQGVESKGGPRATLNFASDITQAPSVIALLEGADLSSFLHESGHFFLEVQADLATRIEIRINTGDTVSEAERGILDDMNTLLDWFGVTDIPEATALDQWAMKTLEERREAHETFARGFEKYAMEGKAPTQELAGLFNKFRSWLLSVYQKLASLNVTLTDDVRAVMDRMLASDEAIQEAQAARNMGPLFQSPEQAGMTPKEYDTYQFLGERATAAASEELDARLMKDMKWLSRAKSKAIKAAQEEAAQIRRDTELEVRREVMAQPIYQAWQILTGKGLSAEDRLIAEKKGKATTLNPAVDNLFAAIAKLGGLDKAQAQSQWGVEDKLESGVFGAPVLRVEGGLGIDAMAERLVEEGYLMPDTGGRADLAKFAELFDDQRRGVDRYSLQYEFNLDGDGAPIEAVDLTNRFAKLNTEELRRRYGTAPDAVWRILSERRMTNDTGLDPDLLAESIPGGGFTSGDELVRKLAAAPPPRQVIEEEVDQRMMERYGDITSPEALSQAADEAVHNELRARVIATELKALQKAGKVLSGERSTVNVLAKAAKEYAAQVIARQRVRDLRPSQYTAAEARSAKLAEQALGKDMAEAALHKRNQLINNYAARAAYDAQDEVKAMQTYFRKFDKRRDSIDPGYQDQIEQLLENFDFKPASLKAIDKRKSFAAWYEEQAKGDNPPDVPDYLLEEAGRKSYKDMTVEELRGLRDTIKQIEHQGRLKNKLLLARDQRDFDASATAMANSIVEHGGEARQVNLEGPNPVTDWFAGVAASHRKLSSLFRQMDGNKDDGPMYDLIGRGMNERGTMEDVMVEKATVALRDIYAPLMKMRGGITGARSKLYIPEINASLTRGGRLAVALNWGNEANRQRIVDGDKWSQGQVQAILKTLTPVELKFVNDVWAYIDSYWEDIAAKEKRLTGVEPEKVEALPFAQVADDGTEVQMRGGYYPLKYDTDRSDRADTQEAAQAAKEMMQGVMTRSTTRRGHTKERLKEVKRAVRKDLNVITQHVTQVTHDLAWHEWLIDTNKLLKDDRVVSAIRDHYGPKVLKTIRDDVLGIATADVVPQDSVDKALLLLRSNVTRATMGASITTAFLQPFGLTQSMVRIGPQHVLRGMARWGGDAARMENTVEWIRGKSEFMRLRSKTFNRELREIRGAVAGKSQTMRVVDAGLFALMQKMQLVADVPTWIGQYEKSTAEGLDEAAAVAMADRAVLESQGGGATKDLAEVQRKHPMLTQFYSYFSVTLNLAAEQTAATNFKNPAAVAGWLGDMALLMVIPAILPALIMYGLKGGDDDEDWAKRIAQWQLGYLLGTVVGLRELSGGVGGFDYAGPPVGRVVSASIKFGKQLAQGEVDEPAVLSLVELIGAAFGIPTVQILRSYKGWKAWDEGQEGAGPQSVLFGPPPKD